MTKDYFSLYREENDEFQRQLKRTRNRNDTPNKSYALIVVLLLFVVGLGGAMTNNFFSRSTTQLSTEPLSVDIDATQQAISGQTFRVAIRIKNESTENMSSLSLFAEYPEGFHYERSDIPSENAEHTFWKLKPLDRTSDYSFILEGTLEGDPGIQRDFHFKLNYGYEGSRAEFVIIRDHTVTLNQSNTSLEIKGPELVRPEEEVEYIISYGDLASLPQTDKNYELRVKLPDSFMLNSSEPPPDRNGNWSNELLKQNLSPLKRFGKIKLKGAFTKESMGDLQIGSELGIVKGNTFIIAQHNSLTTSVVSNDLQIGIIINGSPDQKPLSLGAPLDMTLTYKNISTIPLEDVKIRMRGEGAALNWIKFENPSFARYENETLSWSKKEVEQFSRLEPGTSGELKTRIALHDADELYAYKGDKKKDSITFEITSTITQKKQSESLTTDQKPLNIMIPLNSDARISAAVRSGDILGQSASNDNEQLYTVELTVENSFHELTALSIAVPLIDEASWLNKFSRSAGDISFDKKSSSVLWTLNRLPTDIGSVRASFVVLVASHKQRNSTTITSEGIFDAIDKVTDDKIHILIKPLQILESK